MNAPEKQIEKAAPEGELVLLMQEAFGQSASVIDLAGQFLSPKGYDNKLSRTLIRLARSPSEPWEFRLFCALLLQWQFLRISPKDLDTLDALLVQIGLKSRKGAEHPLKKRVIDEGFQSRDLKSFSKEWRRFLGRQKHLFKGIRGRRTTTEVIHGLIQLSKCPTKVSLSRYLIKPREVIAQILREVRVTRGIRAPYVEESTFISGVTKRIRKQFPRFEREILDRLCQLEDILWVSDDTSSELNALVEYPLGTIVLVVKPPGSRYEFEIKRAGKRGSRPLDVVYSRDGKPVPPSHRLNGGSILWCQQFEADSSARISRVFQLVHGADLSCARTHRINSIYGIPTDDGERSLMDYLTLPSVYGSGHESMREALGTAAQKGMHASRPGVSELPGELGTSHNFLIKYWPGQAIQSGNSSFRIDLVNRYLSPAGPKHYFVDGLGKKFTLPEARAFAEALLQEILGDYRRPEVRFKNHTQFIKAAFKVAANRRAADRNYLSLLDQIGTFWGTLLAMRGFSNGESFVSRNIGLKSVWDCGRWKTIVVFMDHDDLHLPGDKTNNFLPLNILDGQCTDQNFLVGLSEDRVRTSLFTQLGEIYRIAPDLQRKGLRRLNKEKQRAYFKTQGSFKNNQGLRRMFTPMFADRIRDWDRAMRVHMKALSEGRDPKAAVGRVLKKWGYGENITEHYLKALWKFDEAWARLFDIDGPG